MLHACSLQAGTHCAAILQHVSPVQAHCKGKAISLAPVPGFDTKTLADLMRAVLLLQQPATGPAADPEQAADEEDSEQSKVQIAVSVLDLQ